MKDIIYFRDGYLTKEVQADGYSTLTEIEYTQYDSDGNQYVIKISNQYSTMTEYIACPYVDSNSWAWLTLVNDWDLSIKDDLC